MREHDLGPLPRLLICAAAAYAAVSILPGLDLGSRWPELARYLEWAGSNKIQAAALAALALYLISLSVWPLETSQEASGAFAPCE